MYTPKCNHFRGTCERTLKWLILNRLETSLKCLMWTEYIWQNTPWTKSESWTCSRQILGTNQKRQHSNTRDLCHARTAQAFSWNTRCQSPQLGWMGGTSFHTKGSQCLSISLSFSQVWSVWKEAIHWIEWQLKAICCYTALRRIAMPLLLQVKTELQNIEELGVVSRVEKPMNQQTYVQAWSSSQKPVEKFESA